MHGILIIQQSPLPQIVISDAITQEYLKTIQAIICNIHHYKYIYIRAHIHIRSAQSNTNQSDNKRVLSSFGFALSHIASVGFDPVSERPIRAHAYQ